MAVQTKGLDLLLWALTYSSILAIICLTLVKLPRRMARRMKMLNHVSTWLSHEA